jgi:hypothetical protein
MFTAPTNFVASGASSFGEQNPQSDVLALLLHTLPNFPMRA